MNDYLVVVTNQDNACKVDQKEVKHNTHLSSFFLISGSCEFGESSLTKESALRCKWTHAESVVVTGGGLQ